MDRIVVRVRGAGVSTARDTHTADTAAAPADTAHRADARGERLVRTRV